MPPIAGGTVEPPLKGGGRLTVGYGDSGWPPHTFYLREGQKVDVGILKLFLSRKEVNLSHVPQSSPFAPVGGGTTVPSSSLQTVVPIGGHSTTPSLQIVSSRSHGTARACRTVASDSEDFDSANLPLPWDTVEFTVVQRCATGRGRNFL